MLCKVKKILEKRIKFNFEKENFWDPYSIFRKNFNTAIRLEYYYTGNKTGETIGEENIKIKKRKANERRKKKKKK